jgi:CspA family cold shock protein
MSNELFKGTLNAYDPLKGYGFIRREQGKDVFVHFSAFIGDDKDANATIGVSVEFELDKESPKPRAINVKITG